MQQDIARVLIDRGTIAQRVRDIAGQITRDLCGCGPDELTDASACGRLTLVPILTGSIIFVADLIRQLPLYMQIRLMSVSSYPGTATSSRGANIQKVLTDLPDRLNGADVLVIDDILDSGGTLRLVTQVLRDKGARHIRTCVLLRKQRPEAMAFPVDYVAFDIPDEFVVGYGLDYNDTYRNLPDIVVLHPQVIESADNAGSIG